MRPSLSPRLLFGLALSLSQIGCHARPDASPDPTDKPTPGPSTKGKPVADARPAPADADAPEQPPPSFDPKPPGPPANNGVDELHRLEGALETDLLHEFGEPSSRREFPMGECCSEFEIELYNTYPPKAGHDKVVIRQWDWDYEGYTLTVWLHQLEGQWVALETCRYGDGVEF